MEYNAYDDDVFMEDALYPWLADGSMEDQTTESPVEQDDPWYDEDDEDGYEDRDEHLFND